MTLVEQGVPEASRVMQAVDSHSGRAYTVGVTGPPGAGKSTLVNGLAALLRREGGTVGIIAADPTSPFSGGALLGDRVRMQRHYLDSQVFIRSVATRGQAGGLPRAIKTMARLLDAAGKETVLVETVGVGQTELGVMEVADTVLVTLVPESGDAIQTLKAGIMEIADIYVINKADREGAAQMASAVTAMQGLAQRQEWTPPVVLTQAHSGEGIPELWSRIQEHRQHVTQTSELARRRQTRRVQEFVEMVEGELGRRWRAKLAQDPGLAALKDRVGRKELEPYSAALQLVETLSLSSH
jgi:LAO/AO transport system kinase